MYRWLSLLSVLGAVVGCGASFEPGGPGTGGSAGTAGSGGSATAGSGGSGGAAAGAGGSTTGGSGTGGSGTGGAQGGTSQGGGGGVPPQSDCDQLIGDYFAALDDARDCDPEVDGQCNHSWVFQGPCGCDVPYNSFEQEKIDDIEALWALIQDADCQIIQCGAPCVEVVGVCGAQEGGTRTVCQ